MGVVIDRVTGRMEPPSESAAGGAEKPDAAAPARQGGSCSLEHQLRRSERRRLRLEAD